MAKNMQQTVTIRDAILRVAPNSSSINAVLTSCSDINDVKAANGETRYYDLQGRQVAADTPGILIQVTRLSDGTVRTAKVIH